MPRTLPVLRSASLFVGNQADEDEGIRTVEVYEIEYYFEDGGTNQVNGIRYPIKRGDVLIAKPGDLRHSTLPFCCLYLHILKATGDIKQLLDSLPSVISTDDSFYEETFRSIIQLFLSASPADQITATGMLLQLIGRLSTLKYSATSTVNQANRIVSKAMRYISAHYAEDITVETVAKSCNVSVSYLHKLFMKIRGISPHAAILNHRIKTAKAMLMNSKLSLSEIAVQCGFHSQAYFSDCFKRKVGTAPGEFRSSTIYRL